jgi:hypothetical protein
MPRFSSQTIISKLWTIERVYKWLDVEKDNISLNTQQPPTMSKYSTYQSPNISPYKGF